MSLFCFCYIELCCISILAVIADNRDGIMAFKTDLSKHFHLKELKELRYILSIVVTR